MCKQIEQDANIEEKIEDMKKKNILGKYGTWI